MSKFITRANRSLFDAQIPLFLRERAFGWYGRWYSVDFSDVAQPLDSYANLGQFFCRSIKARAIPSEKNHLLVPADSKVLSISEVTTDECFIVKDISYSLGEFMTGVQTKFSPQEIGALKRNPNNSLYQVIFYLAPGDYHRFHSPSDFEVVNKTVLEGALYPVNQQAVRKFGGTIYQKNERALLEGRYWNGYLNLAMVGAMNVGTIELHPKDKFEMGEEIGMFKLGSTIVMHFEAPPKTKFAIHQDQKVRYGDVIY